MEAQAQEEMEREVACDVVHRNAEPGPGRQIVESLYADVGDDSVRRVRAELTNRVASADHNVSAPDWAESRITTEARRIQGRTLVLCGTRVVTYDLDSQVADTGLDRYETVRVVTSTSL